MFTWHACDGAGAEGAKYVTKKQWLYQFQRNEDKSKQGNAKCTTNNVLLLELKVYC